MHTIAVQNVKGGVGKTTTSLHLATGILEKKPGSKILIVDCDSQANISAYFKIPHNHQYGDFFDFLVEEKPFSECVQTVSLNGKKSLDVVVSSRQLADADIRLSTKTRREEVLLFRFREEGISELYDFVIFDCPPTLNLVTYNILTFCDYLVIPTEMDSLSLRGVQTLMENINMVNKYFDKTPKVLGVLPTKYDGRLKVTSEIHLALKHALGSTYKIYSPIRKDAAVQNAQAKKLTVFEFAKNSRAAQDYLKFITTLLNQIKADEVKSKIIDTLVPESLRKKRPEAREGATL